LTKIVKLITIKIMTTSPHPRVPRHVPPLPDAELDREASGSRAKEVPPSTFRLSPDGVPMRKVPAPLARRFQQICASMVGEALAGSGIVQLEFAALAFVIDVPGIEQWRLAEALGIDRTNAGLVSERLEQKGLVQRRVNGSDRRAREVHPTARGKATYNRLLPKIRGANAGILAPLLAAERTLFIDLLITLIEGNRDHARPGAGRRKRRSARAQRNGDSR
jgi:DNA-binding MarR family transcriptional regulator